MSQFKKFQAKLQNSINKDSSMLLLNKPMESSTTWEQSLLKTISIN